MTKGAAAVFSSEQVFEVQDAGIAPAQATAISSHILPQYVNSGRDIRHSGVASIEQFICTTGAIKVQDAEIAPKQFDDTITTIIGDNVARTQDFIAIVPLVDSPAEPTGEHKDGEFPVPEQAVSTTVVGPAALKPRRQQNHDFTPVPLSRKRFQRLPALRIQSTICDSQ